MFLIMAEENIRKINDIDKLFCIKKEKDEVHQQIPTVKSYNASPSKLIVAISGVRRKTKSPVESLLTELTIDTMETVKFFKRKIKERKQNKNTEVKKIYISPEMDKSKWEQRPVISKSSTTSPAATYSSCNGGSRDDGIKVVHDMANESPDL